MGKAVKVAAILVLGACSIAGAVLIRHSDNQSDYRMFTAKSERELTHAAGHVTHVSDHMPHVEIQFDDGQVALATFVTFPIYRGKSLYVTDTGAYGATLPRLLTCHKVDLELLPISRSLTSYWIYGLSCDGELLLSYADTIRYVQAQATRIGLSTVR
ncbi:hypothetical protein [Paraburkholderia antibiotica]|uniref:hypothetical protein n=1 Tax=Paraburkholderia antibiotica TaxID=2728839 RepID=UPI00197F4FDD|nr:hypothetical protein [Paraburkholderia antibiotica]